MMLTMNFGDEDSCGPDLPSADEVSQLDHDFVRARSLEPDRPQALPTLGMGIAPQKKGKQIARSLDSIADDSGFQDVDVKMLKEKIVYLQDQVKVKENEVEVIKKDQDELHKLKAEVSLPLLT